MALFDKQFTRSRPGHVDSKLWVSWPVKIRPAVVDELYRGLRKAYPHENIRVVVNGRQFTVDQYGPENPGTAIMYSQTQKIESVALVASEKVWVFLGPRTAYAFSYSDGASAHAALWHVKQILKAARRPFGTFLVRTWGAAIAVVGAAIGAAYVFGGSTSAQARDVSVLYLLGALAVYLFVAAITGAFRRVRHDFAAPGTGNAVGRWFASTLSALFVTVIGALLLRAVLGYLFPGATP